MFCYKVLISAHGIVEYSFVPTLTYYKISGFDALKGGDQKETFLVTLCEENVTGW